MSERTKLRDIADRARVSISTVSRALQNDPQISERRRREIQQIAKTLRYRPDPILSSLAARRWRGGPAGSEPSLAFVTSIPTGKPLFGNLLELCRQAARRRGYRLERFDRSEFASCAQMSSVLYNRGICGLIIGRALDDAPPLDLDWDLFAIVAIAGAWREVPCPFYGVNTDMFVSVELAFREVWNRGYRRIGLAPFRHPYPVSDDAVRLGACYYVLNTAGRGLKKIPPCLAEPGEDGRSGFMQWFERHRPDAIISLTVLPYYWLQEAGYRIPQDAGFASLLVEETHECAGCGHMQDQWAEAAIEMLDSQIRHGQRGIPPVARTTMVEPRWFPGPSL